jgi:hypothetical protein
VPTLPQVPASAGSRGDKAGTYRSPSKLASVLRAIRGTLTTAILGRIEPRRDALIGTPSARDWAFESQGKQQPCLPLTTRRVGGPPAVPRQMSHDRLILRTSGGQVDPAAAARRIEPVQICMKRASDVSSPPHRRGSHLRLALKLALKHPHHGWLSGNAAVLKTGSGRQGHSWVRIPPPPLIQPNPHV